MSFDAHGSVQGAPTEQAVLEGGVIPEVSPSPTETPAPKPEAPAPQKVGEPRKIAAVTPTEVPAFTPNYKFKVMDKEHEMDEFVRGAIKDADSEKKLKELYEKAYGLDVIKPRFQGLRETHQTVLKENQGYKQSIEQLSSQYQRGDLDGFFKTLGVPEEKILQWIVDKANYQQLEPHQRQMVDAKTQAENQAYQLQQENQSLTQRQQNLEIQARAQTLQIALERPETSSFVQRFEEKAGKQGSFIQEVIAHGERTYYASGGKTDLSPEQAIKDVMERWSPFLGPESPKQAPFIPANPGQQPQAAPKVATIPNISGRQSTAVSKTSPRSIEDLKALYKKKSGF